MRNLIAIALLFIAAAATAHYRAWPTNIIPLYDQPTGYEWGGACRGTIQNGCSLSMMRTMAQNRVNNIPGQEGIYEEVHVLEFKGVYEGDEYHAVFRRIWFDGQMIWQFIAEHTIGGGDCGAHVEVQNIGK